MYAIYRISNTIPSGRKEPLVRAVAVEETPAEAAGRVKRLARMYRYLRTPSIFLSIPVKWHNGKYVPCRPKKFARIIRKITGEE